MPHVYIYMARKNTIAPSDIIGRPLPVFNVWSREDATSHPLHLFFITFANIDIIEAHVTFDVEDKWDQLLRALRVFHKVRYTCSIYFHQGFILIEFNLMQDYDISTLHVSTASPMNNSFKRTVYIKFDLNPGNSELFQNFDEFASKLESNDKPTEIMRESIEVYPGLTSTQTESM